MPEEDVGTEAVRIEEYRRRQGWAGPGLLLTSSDLSMAQPSINFSKESDNVCTESNKERKCSGYSKGPALFYPPLETHLGISYINNSRYQSRDDSSKDPRFGEIEPFWGGLLTLLATIARSAWFRSQSAQNININVCRCSKLSELVTSPRPEQLPLRSWQEGGGVNNSCLPARAASNHYSIPRPTRAGSPTTSPRHLHDGPSLETSQWVEHVTDHQRWTDSH
ncbi:hypothetical protein RRG08_067082 [Elysia crispata]|uniref:Uncharacterized protein n=1 Tax=Elysia crispata TaxID=231223 RepID=A0AAE1B7K4_9GAST|nr:hypothetical protein RRG08_067082 [Elysia crispata]